MKVTGSHLLLYLMLVKALLFLPGCSVLVAQPGEKPDGLAVVLSATQLTGKKATAGAKVFVDKEYVLATLPGALSNMDYLPTSMSSANRIVPVTEGYVYMLTPVAGQEGSQEAALLATGFVKTTQAPFKIFRGQQQEVMVLKKYISFEKFRLGHIEYNGWAIPLFGQRALPSVTIPAKWTWMPPDAYGKSNRLWQGCPSIEKTGQRLWSAWFSGGTREPDTANYGIVSYSDDGKKWIDPAMVIYHPDCSVRVMDTQLWKDPGGRLWVFWTQNTGPKGFDGIWGTWAVYTNNPEAAIPDWSAPKRLCDGLTRNKPVVLSSGEWLLPSYNWVNHQSALYVSKDKGNTWELQGGPINEPVDNFYEHMCVELKNGHVWMLQRNIQSGFSSDKGITWSGLDTLQGLTSANARLYIGRLHSGRLLLIYNNDADNKRKNLTVFLSGDEGKTWPYSLLLDERDNVSYPDMVQDAAGRIYVIYDRSRAGEKEILMAMFTEEDIVKAGFVSANSVAKMIVSKAGQ